MIQSDFNRFGRTLYILYPGDYIAAESDCIMATVTGSCMVVCLHDTVNRIGGVGHFIVPGSIGTEGIVADEVAKQGITSMEHLMGEIVKLGGTRKSMSAKLFGAASLNSNLATADVSGSNIRFLHEYFRLEGIYVAGEDLGGAWRRKIYFWPTTGVSYRKILHNNCDHSEFIKLEAEYINMVFNAGEKYGRVLLFD